ncbi:MAG: UvrD-helicase domain-containing protein [Firmicutes bacterium]|nr:UvrD-helicase domain-containing protein [Bacillota bacterium]
MDYKKLLNEHQYQAVSTPSQYVRIIAGAGSGKTRVLTYRIAYLIGELHVEPWKILAITFTNKVAKEMRERAIALVPEAAADLHVLTFHSFCARFLRREISVLGYPTTFTIFDEDDQESLVKSIAEDNGYRKSDDIVGQTLSYIASNKTAGRLPKDIVITKINFPNEKECLRLFTIYEERLNFMYALDFDDLLLKTIKILEEYPNIKTKWQNRIDHVLIDEFQDTNDVQYRLLKLMLKPSCSLYVVGDPDQTIYTWRGANQAIILDIDKAFPMETIILDRNYRSTQTILNTANELISHNRLRVKKDLYTENEGGAEIINHRALRADDEAEWVLREIQKLRYNKKFKYSDVALLYRASYLTLPFEKAFNRYHIPYRIFGGVRFYQRREIKDVLAYFRLLSNKKDNVSFERIMNVPRRGIGEKTIDLLKHEAFDANLAIYEYVEEIDKHTTEIKTKCVVSLTDMIKKIDNCRSKLLENLEAFSEVLKEYITAIGYYDYLAEDDEKDRLDNVNALFDDILSYMKDNPQSGFDEYLQNVSLTSAQDDINDGDYVSLMTVHTAKGLEFKSVFVVGLNEGVFPSERTLTENAFLGLEEERRLCYVALTRAKEKLFLSCNGEYSFIIQARKVPSRFFKEAGINFERPKEYAFGPQDSRTGQKSTPSLGGSLPSNGITDWAEGDRVEHKTFGPGVVLKIIDDTIIEVEFETAGRKKLLASHPAISRIDKNTGGMA